MSSDADRATNNEPPVPHRQLFKTEVVNLFVTTNHRPEKLSFKVSDKTNHMRHANLKHDMLFKTMEHSEVCYTSALRSETFLFTLA